MARLRPCPGSGGTTGMTPSLSSRTRTPKSCASRLPMSAASPRQTRRKANPLSPEQPLPGVLSENPSFNGAGYRSPLIRCCWFRPGRWFRGGCVGLLAAGQEVFHAFHSEEGGDDGDEDGCELQGTYLGQERGHQDHSERRGHQRPHGGGEQAGERQA